MKQPTHKTSSSKTHNSRKTEEKSSCKTLRQPYLRSFRPVVQKASAGSLPVFDSRGGHVEWPQVQHLHPSSQHTRGLGAPDPPRPECLQAAAAEHGGSAAERAGLSTDHTEESQRFPADCPRNWGCVGRWGLGAEWGGHILYLWNHSLTSSALALFLLKARWTCAAGKDSMHVHKSDTWLQLVWCKHTLRNTCKHRSTENYLGQLQSRSPRSKCQTLYYFKDTISRIDQQTFGWATWLFLLLQWPFTQITEPLIQVTGSNLIFYIHFSPPLSLSKGKMKSEA